MKRCYACTETKPQSDFHKSANRKDGLNSRCKKCQITFNKARYDKDPQEFKLRRIERRYGIARDTYAEMIKNGCEVCGSHKLLHVDHDHSCCPNADNKTCGNCIRGILCKDCNTAEGLLHGNPAVTRKLANYMEKFIA